MKRYKIVETQSHGAIIQEDFIGEWVKYEDIQKEFGEKCDCCGEYGRDRRTLWMGCGYDMNELNVPFVEKKDEGVSGFFTLRVCKHCRGNWMTAIKEWFLKHGKPREE